VPFIERTVVTPRKRKPYTGEGISEVGNVHARDDSDDNDESRKKRKEKRKESHGC
jgi:hypothetical protein